MRTNQLRPSIAEPSIGDFGLLDHLDTINIETPRDFLDHHELTLEEFTKMTTVSFNDIEQVQY